MGQGSAGTRGQSEEMEVDVLEGEVVEAREWEELKIQRSRCRRTGGSAVNTATFRRPGC